MTVNDWHNSHPMKNFRQAINGDSKQSQCKGCYYEESHGYESRRVKENFKSVIFTEQAFDKSFQQSPTHRQFHKALDQEDMPMPVDWHIDLGNECNLACKMCGPSASSLIASKYSKLGLPYTARDNWVNNANAWNNFIASLDSIKVNRLHFMGGEPMLSKKFRVLVDHLLTNKRQDVSISFVTNGTILDQEFIDKLKQFRSFDLEISLESITESNHYIRQGQGESTQKTIDNIEKLISQQTDTFHVILRSVPQLLNISTYDQYIRYAWDKKVSIQGIPLTGPDFLAIAVLPLQLRQTFIPLYQKIIDDIESESAVTNTIVTGRNVGHLNVQLIREAKTMITLLSANEPSNVEELRTKLSQWLIMWDKEFNLDARNFYPEYAEFLNDIQYRV
jgi:sulfatase maturation enzyme AslB (radical SAM superfamily)